MLISCTTIHEAKEFKLEELNLAIQLPANSIVKYDAPSHSDDIPRYHITYNDGNSSHSSVQVSLDRKKDSKLTSLKELMQAIKKRGGTILDEYIYGNGFMGYSYEKDGDKLYQFIRNDEVNGTYVLSPNEIYNNQHKYLSVILKAIESIEMESV